jgi:guanylate kinase
MAHGTLVVVNGPSGSGKGTLVSYIRAQFPQIGFSVSCTTRAMRPNDVEGVTYYFITPEAFKEKIEGGEFLEWAKFGKNYYGTLKSEVLPRLEKGEVLILEIEIQGAWQVAASTPKEHLLFIYIDAGSWEHLEKRIVGRAPITSEELEDRKKRYGEEVSFKNEADVVIPNLDGGLESAKARMKEAIAPLFSNSAE